MTAFVLALSIGPVGGFIAAGRRSRDLWYGSSWLSETTRAVAEHLREDARWPAGIQDVTLLLPTRERLDALRQRYEASGGLEGGRVSNKVLARVTCAADADAQAALHALARACRERASRFLVDQLEGLRADPLLERLLDIESFDRQVEAIRRGDFVECSAAWAPVRPGEDEFGESVGRACRLRDATPRLFVQPGFSRLGVSRSDLDEGRDSVLRADEPRLRVPRAKAGLIESEELDAIGLLRRAGPYLHRAAGDTRLRSLPFRPLPNAAVDPWLEGVTKDPEARDALAQLCETVRRAAAQQGEDFFVWCSPAAQADPGQEGFPFEASLLFEGGCDALLASVDRLRDASGGAWKAGAAVHETLERVGRQVRQLHRRMGLPSQYYALVEADGDRIGAWLAEQRTQPAYERLVQALDAFADGAADIVLGERGTAFYVAGDELAAYVPLDRALDLVAKLARSFRSALEAKGFPYRTLSAGVVIAHVKDDLRGARRAARRALQLAKDTGGGHVCLREMPRSGSDREITGPIEAVHPRMETLIGSIQGGDLSLRTEQHLRDHLERFEGVAAAPGVPPGVRLAQDAVRRQLGRAGRDARGILADRIDRLESWADVRGLADELRIASRIADACVQRRVR